MPQLLYVAGKNYTLAGSGVTSSATSLTLTSFTLPDSAETPIVTADFDSLGYLVLEPRTARMEIVSFTGVTQNADGTATITGLTRGLGFVSPYTNVAANQLAHPGGSIAILSNPPQLYADLKAYIDGIAIAGSPDASTTAKGLVEIATSTEVNAKTGTGSTGAILVVPASATAVPTDNEKNAMAGGSTFGTPSTTNKFITQDYNSSATGLPVVRVYTASTTWTKPAGLKYVISKVVGGGGGGASGAGTTRAEGGGGGGYSEKLIAVASLGATETVTVGAAGSAGSGGVGGTGGTSSFGSHLSATGGTGGGISANGRGGIGSNGSINARGQDGGPSSTVAGVGFGGSSVLGGGGASVVGSAGTAGGAYGGGGAGGTSGENGGAGAAGVVIVIEYYS